ncbi:SET domain-containing methyltransferase [Mesorhizobium sp. M0058]|uniref:SET domain-containing methyltransferase n=1 Tax=Mesorhizobium sp. M0058 TaxID=2956865 RepID=UPI00333B3872
MPTPCTSKAKSILIDDIGCAKEINARNVRIAETSGKKGRGVFAAREFMPGEIVVAGLVDRIEKNRTTHSVQLDWNIHALFLRPAVLMNHSCDPNTAVVPNRFGGYDFIAIHNIVCSDELTWDYATTEFDSIAVEVCLCSSKKCRGTAGGFSRLPRDHQLIVTGFYAPYLSEKAPGQFPRRIGLFSKFVGS